jgi:hypothetical protein
MLVIGSVPATANAVTAASPQCASVTLDARNASSTLGFMLRSQVSQLDTFATWTDCAFANTSVTHVMPLIFVFRSVKFHGVGWPKLRHGAAVSELATFFIFDL